MHWEDDRVGKADFAGWLSEAAYTPTQIYHSFIYFKSPKTFAYDKFTKKKPGFDKDQELLTLHDSTPSPIILYAQLKV